MYIYAGIHVHTHTEVVLEALNVYVKKERTSTYISFTLSTKSTSKTVTEQNVKAKL